ncbi:MAG: hypothetical protein KIT72_05450 [Polyangiaceae bacterium]|nr:hypothetical protein [Polyangiaceae bacterium]MCW5789844.1 hypothetical protein [Polyangiaceae bacterium]
MKGISRGTREALATVQLNPISAQPVIATGSWRGYPARYEEIQVHHHRGRSLLTLLVMQRQSHAILALRAVHHQGAGPPTLPRVYTADADFDARFQVFAHGPAAQAVLRDPRFRLAVTGGRRRGRPGEILSLDMEATQTRITISGWSPPPAILRSALELAANVPES